MSSKIRRSSFTDTELRLLDEWVYGSQITKTALQHLDMEAPEYWGLVKSIADKFGLPRRGASKATVGHACGMAVVLGLFDQNQSATRGQPLKGAS